MLTTINERFEVIKIDKYWDGEKGEFEYFAGYVKNTDDGVIYYIDFTKLNPKILSKIDEKIKINLHALIDTDTLRVKKVYHASIYINIDAKMDWFKRIEKVYFASSIEGRK